MDFAFSGKGSLPGGAGSKLNLPRVGKVLLGI